MSQSDLTHERQRWFFILGQLPVSILLLILCGCAVYCISQRIAYPFEIEWLENDTVTHGMMLVKEHTLYAAPSTEFISELYPPVYYLVTALFYKLFDTVNFLIPRLISVMSLAGILILMYLIPVKEGGRRNIGLMAGGFFLSLYELHDTWYDLARVDMLFFFLLLLGCYILAYAQRKTMAALWGAIILVLACYTKQSGVYFLPFAAAYLFFKDRKQCVIFSSAAFVLLVSFFFALQYATDGWFGTFVLFNPLRYYQVTTKPVSELQFQLLFEMRHKLYPEMRYEILYKLPVFFVLALAFLLQRALSITKKPALAIWEYTAVAAAFAYFSVRPHPGTMINDLMYMTVWGCILLGLFLVKLTGPEYSDVRDSKRVTVYLLLAVQLCLLLYNPKPLVPTPQDVKKGRELISMVKNMPGEVYLPYHSWYGVMAGKHMIFNGGAYWAYQILAKELFIPEDLIEKIKKKYFSAIIIDDQGYLTAKGERVVIDNVKLLLTSGDAVSKAVAENYRIAERIPYSTNKEFRTIACFQTRPELILVPKDTRP